MSSNTIFPTWGNAKLYVIHLVNTKLRTAKVHVIDLVKTKHVIEHTFAQIEQHLFVWVRLSGDQIYFKTQLLFNLGDTRAYLIDFAI